jgi:26S proteasome regulatory subunit N2
LLLDRTPDEPVQPLELKVRKAPVTSGPGHSVGGSANQDNTGGAAAAVNILNAEDDEGDDDAPVPEEFEYHTDSEES